MEAKSKICNECKWKSICLRVDYYNPTKHKIKRSFLSCEFIRNIELTLKRDIKHYIKQYNKGDNIARLIILANIPLKKLILFVNEKNKNLKKLISRRIKNEDKDGLCDKFK